MAAYPPAVKSTIPFMFTYKAGVDTKVLQMTRRCCNGQSPTEIALAMREYYHHSFMEAQAAYYRVVDALRAAGGGAQPRVDAVFAASQPVRLGLWGQIGNYDTIEREKGRKGEEGREARSGCSAWWWVEKQREAAAASLWGR